MELERISSALKKNENIMQSSLGNFAHIADKQYV